MEDELEEELEDAEGEEADVVTFGPSLSFVVRGAAF